MRYSRGAPAYLQRKVDGTPKAILSNRRLPVVKCRSGSRLKGCWWPAGRRLRRNTLVAAIHGRNQLDLIPGLPLSLVLFAKPDCKNKTCSLGIFKSIPARNDSRSPKAYKSPQQTVYGFISMVGAEEALLLPSNLGDSRGLAL